VEDLFSPSCAGHHWKWQAALTEWVAHVYVWGLGMTVDAGDEEH